MQIVFIYLCIYLLLFLSKYTKYVGWHPVLVLILSRHQTGAVIHLPY